MMILLAIMMMVRKRGLEGVKKKQVRIGRNNNHTTGSPFTNQAEPLADGFRMLDCDCLGAPVPLV